MKICKRCKVELPLTEFYKDSAKKDKLTIYCKACCKVAENAYHKKNPVMKANRKRKSMIYKSGLKITMDDYNQMLNGQNHKCGICHTTMDVPRIDHNHSTGYIRMLLCGPCNTMLGMAKENVITLQNAINYLNKFNKV
jgi:hypothetical protein